MKSIGLVILAAFSLMEPIDTRAENLSAPIIGDWQLATVGQMLATDGSVPPRAYFIETELDAQQRLSPWFAIRCTAQHYVFELVDANHPGRRWNGTMNIVTDNGQTIAVDATSEEPFEITSISSANVPKQTLDKIDTAHAVISVSIDGWNNQMKFPVKGIDTAMAALALLCSYRSQ